MSREWNPGDVALVNYGFGEKLAMRDHRGWTNPTIEINDEAVESARPVVVIDPDDDEQNERLWITLRDGHALHSRSELRAALREFADPTPPRPVEPTGLGAVVEDDKGVRFINSPVGKNDSRPWTSNNDGSCREWAELNVVEVLSEGVTP